MNKKIISILAVLALFIVIGCEEVSEDSSDVTYVPIDDIITESSQSSDEEVSTDDEIMDDDTMDDDAMVDHDAMDEDTMDEAMEDDDSDAISEEAEIIQDILESVDEDLDLVTEEDILNDEVIDQVSDAETQQDVVESTDTITVEIEDVTSPLEDVTSTAEEDVTTMSEIVIIVEETSLVNLKPEAFDPDDDVLTYTYTTPLDEDGLWQTAYGDMGEYTVTITASDGELTSSKDALLIVNKKEEVPTIDESSPLDMEQRMSEDSDLTFNVEASDLNGDKLTYTWKLDGDVVSTTPDYTYEADFLSSGSHTVKVDVDDGNTDGATILWSVTVANVDRPPVLKLINDITVKENEIVVLSPEAFDPDEDVISFTIEEPLDSGVWQTTYDDAGVYTLLVTVSDGELEDSQEVTVTIINVNRAPVIESIVQVE